MVISTHVKKREAKTDSFAKELDRTLQGSDGGSGTEMRSAWSREAIGRSDGQLGGPHFRGLRVGPWTRRLPGLRPRRGPRAEGPAVSRVWPDLLTTNVGVSGGRERTADAVARPQGRLVGPGRRADVRLPLTALGVPATRPACSPWPRGRPAP